MSGEEADRNAAEDPDDWQPLPEEWLHGRLVIPVRERDQWLLLDPDLAEWFHAQAPAAEARMRAILRAAMEAAKAG